MKSTTGRIMWNVPAGHTGSYGVRVIVHDSQGASDVETLSFVATPTGQVNAPPSLLSTRPPAKTASEGKLYTYSPVPFDPEGKAVTFEPVDPADQTRKPVGLHMDARTGAVSWVPGALGSNVESREFDLTFRILDEHRLSSPVYTYSITPAIRRESRDTTSID